MTAMITTQGRGSWRRIGFIAQALLLNHRNIPTKMGNSAFTSDAYKLFVRNGLRLGVCGDSTKSRRSRVKDIIGCHKEVRTYFRGGARDIKMAEASRRFAAGERATSSHGRKNRRRIHGRTMGCVQGRTPRIKCTGKTKGKLTKFYIRDLRLLTATTTSEGNGVGGGGRGAGAGVASLVPALVNRAVHQCKRRNPEAWAQAKLQ